MISIYPVYVLLVLFAVLLLDVVRLRRKLRLYERATDAELRLGGALEVAGVTMPPPTDARWEYRKVEFESGRKVPACVLGDIVVTINGDVYIGIGGIAAPEHPYGKAVVRAVRQRIVNESTPS